MRIARRSREFLGPLAEDCAKTYGDLDATGEPVTLGIDPSLTSVGLSVYSDSGDHRTVLYKPKFTGPRRLYELRSFVEDFVIDVDLCFRLEEVLIEGYSFGSRGTQAHKIGEGGGAYRLALVDALGVNDRRAYPTIVSPNSLKKFVTGKGKGDKNQILLQVYKKWGVEFDEDDCADAYALARVGEALLLSGGPAHKYEQEVVNALERNTEWTPPLTPS